MFQKDDLNFGVLTGLVCPAIAWFITGYLFKGRLLIMHKPGIPYLLAIAVNLLLMRYLYKKEVDLTANGVIVSTFAFMLVIFFFKLIPVQ